MPEKKPVFQERFSLLRDERGSMLVVGTFALILVLAMIGSGLDLGRAYMTKSRLQQACDAGVLAARAELTSAGWEKGPHDTANAIFSENFQQGQYGSTGLAYSYRVNSGKEVSGQASALVPMSIMRIFGFSSIPVSAACSANQSQGNTDIMFVLDTTGSMKTTNPDDTVNRIDALRDAINNFYTVLPAQDNGDARVRYGFMPFSTNVNVGADMKPAWLASTWNYQTRQPAGFKEYTTSGGTGWFREKETQVSGTLQEITLPKVGETCTLPPSTYLWDSPSTDYIKSETQPNGDVWQYYQQHIVETGSKYAIAYDANGCKIIEYRYNDVRTDIDLVTKPTTGASYKWPNWRYDRYAIDVSAFKTGGTKATISAQTGYGHSMVTFSWGGCIEERGTVWLQRASADPALAYDLDIDLVPSSESTRWGPWIPELIWQRPDVAAMERAEDESAPTNGAAMIGNTAVCPSPARKLATMAAWEVNYYLATLRTEGGTYPDIGMIWGSRYLSPNGIFADENRDAPNTKPISRHIILMTDGQVEADKETLNSYGYERLDRRRLDPDNAPADSDINAVVEDRFLRACANAKKAGITVWVIAFGTDLSPLLKTCSTNNNAFKADNAAQLTKAFSDIAGKIGNLRLTN